MIEKIEPGLGGPGAVNEKTIAVLGLAFKPNTDDMRESPAITICEGLSARGARLRVWDPAAMGEAARRFRAIRERLFFAADEYDAITGADALVLLTEWNQFRNLDLPRVKGLLAQPWFFDLRNIYRRIEVESAGLRYVGIGK
jgi:UDPglucose 6-dehydrogenase